MSLIEAASLSQLEAVLLDVPSLGQLEAASLSLEEALSFCLLKREGAPSLLISVSLLKQGERERVRESKLFLSPSLSLSWREREFSLRREREEHRICESD